MTANNPEDEKNIRLGLDVGTGIIVIATAGPGQDSRTLEFPGISREYPCGPGALPVHGIPSLVEYCDGKPFRRGEAVHREGSAGGASTARWLRRALCDQSPVQVPAGNGRMIRYEEAASDLLVPLLAEAIRAYPHAGLIIALPRNSPDEYGDLMKRIARSAGARSCSLIGEYEAALAGYGCVPAAGVPVVFISFSETDLEVIALVRDSSAGSGTGREGGLRVLARAAMPVGCRLIDSGIVRDLLRKFRLQESDPRAIRLLPQIRYEAERLRELLPVQGEREVRLTDTVSGKIFAARYLAADLERILAEHEVNDGVRDCIGRARAAMPLRGAQGDQVGSVFFLGAGSALPGVRETVRSCFPGAVMHADHPLDAIARGAAGYSAPLPLQDRITRTYALRYWDPVVQEHHYRFLVHSGTPYPSAGQVARIVISAVYDGQTLLGIPLYEIGGLTAGAGPQIELISDTGGGVRLAGPAQDADGSGQAVHANECSPTLLVATPPARKGEPRFECTFTIDPDRNLRLSARDLLTGTLVKVNTPVHRLT